MIIRNAVPGDAASCVRIKSMLRIPSSELPQTVKGGFLLGTSQEKYAEYLSLGNSLMLVDEKCGEAAGFSIILPDSYFRQSGMFAQLGHVQFSGINPGNYLARKICYLEQLAILPEARYRRFGIALSYANISEAFEAGHDILVTTVVIHPVKNLAAVPFMEGVGFQSIGTLDEEYPEYGKIVSEVFFIERETFTGIQDDYKVSILAKVKEMVRQLRC